MGGTTPLILGVSTPAYGRVSMDASDGRCYHADLSTFARVHCYPKTEEEWVRVTPDAAGLALVWSSRFEVHADQVIALADRVEPSRRTA